MTLTQGLIDGVHHCLVPDRHEQHARFRYRHRTDLINRHFATVGTHCNSIEQSGIRPPGPQTRKILTKRFQRAVHAFAIV